MKTSSHTIAQNVAKRNLQAEAACKEIFATLRKAIETIGRKQLADRLGVSEVIISQWISQTRNIPLPRQIEILREARYFTREIRDDITSTLDDIEDLYHRLQFGRAL